MAEEINIGTLTAIIKKEVRMVIREELERVLKVVLAGVRVEKEPHEKRVIVVTQRLPDEDPSRDMTAGVP